MPAAIQPLVDDLLSRSTFPAPGTALDCAVSGGADSSALLVLACAAGCRVTAHHVDHGVRPGSDEEAAVVAGLASRFGAGFVAHTVTVESGPNLEARMRVARFSTLPVSVATGHTLDDRAETILINQMRGAARTGLSSMRVDERHPIVKLRRAETEQLCRELAIEPVRDPSNSDPAFVRNRVRHELVPLLNDIAGRDVAVVLDRQADVLAGEDDFLDELAAAIDGSDARAVAGADPVLARRAIRRFIGERWEVGHPPSREAVSRVLAVAKGEATACDLEEGHRVHRTHQQLRLLPPSIA